MDSTTNISSQVAELYKCTDTTASYLTLGSNGTSYSIMELATIRDQAPRQYRLCKKKNGDLVLQGAFYWSKGIEGGHDWEDLETVHE